MRWASADLIVRLIGGSSVGGQALLLGAEEDEAMKKHCSLCYCWLGILLHRSVDEPCFLVVRTKTHEVEEEGRSDEEAQ